MAAATKVERRLRGWKQTAGISFQRRHVGDWSAMRSIIFDPSCPVFGQR